MTHPVLEPLGAYRAYPPEEMIERARIFYEDIKRRRTVRDFSAKPVPREVIEYALLAAGMAPSGANLQPWHFTAITDPSMKRRIREEAEEREFYNGRAPQERLDALAPLGTDANKVKDNFVTALKKGTVLNVSARNQAGAAVTFVVPTERFGKAFDGPPSIRRPWPSSRRRCRRSFRSGQRNSASV